jgi:hypothetical protein
MWCVEHLLAFVMSLGFCFSFILHPFFSSLLLIAFSPDTCHLPSKIYFQG